MAELLDRIRLTRQVGVVPAGSEGVVVDVYPLPWVAVEFKRDDDGWLTDVPLDALELAPLPR